MGGPIILIDPPMLFLEPTTLHPGLRRRRWSRHLRPWWERHSEVWFVSRLVYATTGVLVALSITLTLLG